MKSKVQVKLLVLSYAQII